MSRGSSKHQAGRMGLTARGRVPSDAVSNGGLHLGRPRISVALGEDAASVESVQVLDKTPYDHSAGGVESPGCPQGQKTLLVRVVLRDLEWSCVWGMGKRALRVSSAWCSRGVSAGELRTSIGVRVNDYVAVRWAEKMR